MSGSRAALLAAGLTLGSLAGPAHADGSLLLWNGNVHTGDAARPHAEAVVAIDGRIVFVGSNEAARQRAPAGIRRIDLGGRTVVPGLSDAHAHLAGIGWRELGFDLAGADSLATLQRRLRERAGADAVSPWILGRGWLESRWDPPVFPTRSDLDAVVADRPVALERGDGHALVANSRALALAGIDRTTADPPGGAVLRDANGEPTGMLIDAAQELVLARVPAPTTAELDRALVAGAARSVRFGWTSLHVAGASFAEVERLCALYAQGRIGLRLYVAINAPGPDAERLLAAGPAPVRCDPRLTVRALKMYVDGALGSRGAALLAPYSDAPDSRGLLVSEPEVLAPLIEAALRRGIQVQMHAIGDRGNRIALDLFEQALARVPLAARAVAEPRLRIEHAQVLDPEDLPRFARLGVIASMQPSHAISDLYFAPMRLGPARLAGAYTWRSLLEAGARIAGGSDAPVE